jgi:uncharacterized protein involved in cysteine biosynthesis
MKTLLFLLGAFAGLFLGGVGVQSLTEDSPIYFFLVSTIPSWAGWTAGIGAILVGLFVCIGNAYLLYQHMGMVKKADKF